MKGFDFGKHLADKVTLVQCHDESAKKVTNELRKLSEAKTVDFMGTTVKFIVDESIPKDEIRIRGIPVKFIPYWDP